MVPYLKLLSTILSQGERTVSPDQERFLSLRHKQIYFNLSHSFPIAHLNIKDVVDDFLAKGSTCVDTWANVPIFGLLIRDTKIRINDTQHHQLLINLDDSILTLYFTRHKKMLHTSAFISSCDAFNILPHRLAAISLLANVIAHDLKLKAVDLSVTIGEAFIAYHERVEVKRFLINPTMKFRRVLVIKKPKYTPYNQTHFSLNVEEIPKARFK